jgi:tRNA A37 threonylcarbamoyladenosine synthetase subunit TsaC/SUA5/YrdC
LIVEELGNPVFSTSVHSQDEVKAYMTDPELIYEEYDRIVDAVIDGGIGGNQVSTIIDCSEEELSIVREGKGEVI